MSSPVFKVGDRIRCIDAYSTDLVRGRTYLVVAYQIAVDSAGLADPGLVYIRRNGRAEGYYRERFQPIVPTRHNDDLRTGDMVRCLDARGYELWGLRTGMIRRVLKTSGDGTELRFCEVEFGRVGVPADRFELIEEAYRSPTKRKPHARRDPLEPGQLVRCLSATGSRLVEGATYTVHAIDDAGRVRLREYPWPTAFLPYRFAVIQPEPAPFKPHFGSLDDEYGPAPPAPPHPIHRAIGKTWPTHRTDIVRALDELRREE
jgi:hypothetical protein